MIKDTSSKALQEISVHKKATLREKAARRAADFKNRWQMALAMHQSQDPADETGTVAKPIVGTRAKIWNICENHPVVNTSVLSVIVLSTISDIVATETKIASPPNSPANMAMEYIDTTCIIIFTIEFLIRICSCPSLIDFARNVMNWIDVLAILPSYVSWIIVAASSDSTAADGGILQVKRGLSAFVLRTPCE